MPSQDVCGPGTNHFCEGFIPLYQARDEKDRRTRLSLLGQAESSFRYTEKWIANYPKCSLHAESRRRWRR